jgi:anti-sigma regulatory factor (Ser/Thr protein kinase)
MSASRTVDRPPVLEPFRHEAFFYRAESEFLDGATAFIDGAVRAGEPILVVVSARKIDLLRRRLGAASKKVRFADMAEVGVNPARIIPAWADFLQEHGGRRSRGIGEPIWAQRSSAELVECQLHESLLNVAFAPSAGFSLMCPYDTAALDQSVVEEARRSHPYLSQGGASSASDSYPGTDKLAEPLATPLPEPRGPSVDLRFEVGTLRALRSVVRRYATEAGFGAPRVDDAVIAVNEVASNSVHHARSGGLLRMWRTPDALLCEVSDHGCLDQPLVGRVRPELDAQTGRGLWIVNQLCDLVQMRVTPTGITVRMHFRFQAEP